MIKKRKNNTEKKTGSKVPSIWLESILPEYQRMPGESVINEGGGRLLTGPVYYNYQAEIPAFPI